MNRNEIIILVGVLCVSAAIWLLTSFPWALFLFGIYVFSYGIIKATND